MNQASVLVISDDPDFSRMVVNRWQAERNMPEFTVMSSIVCDGIAASRCDIAVLGGMGTEALRSMLQKIDAAAHPVIVVSKDAAGAKEAHEFCPRALIVREYLGWVDALVLVACETLKRVEAVQRAKRAEENAAANRRHATLGRYMLEMRHNLNNALTSVLGNAELLLLEPGGLSAQTRDQIDTIHTMSLRIHEIVARFSSLDAEMSFAEKHSHSETVGESHRVASGQ